MAGTLEYMAPEVLLKRPASQASDVYGLAITINELATGAWISVKYRSQLGTAKLQLELNST
jgi:serine/threonine protein kinase